MQRFVRFILTALVVLALLPALPGVRLAPQVAEAATGTYSGGAIGLSAGKGGPYPSTITVTGQPGEVVHLSVTLSTLRYSGPGFKPSCPWSLLDILLVGPDGRSSILMSDVPHGGNDPNDIRTLTFDQFAASNLPNTGSFSDGTFRPTDFEVGDTFPAPAPAGPHGANLDTFLAGPANGTWSLYVVSESTLPGHCHGAIADWTLKISDGAAFSNTHPNVIPDSGPARDYPSEISVSGLSGHVERVTLQLNGVNHEGFADVDVMLVSPSGVAALVLSDAGGSPLTSDPFAVIGIADAAPSTIGQNSSTPSGWYRPRDWPGGDDAFPAPAPPTPAFASLNPLIGVEPNGVWSLYIVDDSPTRDGVITDGWNLYIETDDISPVTSGTLNPLPNSVGWNNNNATFSLSATDPGGSGAKQITYSASGAHTITETTAFDPTISFPFSQEGITTFRYFATDAAGNVETQKQRVIRIDRTAPTVSAPTRILAPTIPTSGVNVRLNWAGSDATSGVVRFELERSKDGGPFTAVTLPTALTTGVTLTLVAGDYQFRTRAFDKAGNVSADATGATFQVIAAGENRRCTSSVTADCLTYAGTWPEETLAGAHHGKVRASSVTGDAATFTFTGQSVSWTTMMGPNRGKARVIVDGIAVATIDLFASSNTRTVAYVNNSLPAGAHTIVIRVQGTKNAASSGTSVAVDVLAVLR